MFATSSKGVIAVHNNTVTPKRQGRSWTVKMLVLWQVWEDCSWRKVMRDKYPQKIKFSGRDKQYKLFYVNECDMITNETPITNLNDVVQTCSTFLWNWGRNPSFWRSLLYSQCRKLWIIKPFVFPKQVFLCMTLANDNDNAAAWATFAYLTPPCDHIRFWQQYCRSS